VRSANDYDVPLCPTKMKTKDCLCYSQADLTALCFVPFRMPYPGDYRCDLSFPQNLGVVTGNKCHGYLRGAMAEDGGTSNYVEGTVACDQCYPPIPKSTGVEGAPCVGWNSAGKEREGKWDCSH